MILSEYDRRWAEIRLYQFCLEIYEVRQQSIDIFDYIDFICSMGDINKPTIKALTRTMLNDSYYTPSRREIILLGHLNNLTSL